MRYTQKLGSEPIGVKGYVTKAAPITEYTRNTIGSKAAIKR